MENTTTNVTAEKVLLTAKGFSDLKLKGIQNLNRVCENFLATGKCVWSMADYMGITGKGTAADKHARFQNQLAENADVDDCVKLSSLSKQVILAMQDTTKPLVIESVALRTYFAPLLKVRGEIKVEEKAVAVDPIDKLVNLNF